MKKIISIALLLILGIFVFVWVLATLNFSEIIAQLRQLKFWQFSLFVIVSLLNFGIVTWRWQIILFKLGHRVSFVKLFLHCMSGYAVSYITPMARVGGEPVRILFLRESEKIRLRDATTSVITDKTLELLTILFFGVIGMTMAVTLDFAPKNLMLPFSFISLVLLFFIIYFFYRLISGKGLFIGLASILKFKENSKLKNLEIKIISVEKQIIDFFSGDKKSLLITVLISFLSAIITVFEFWLVSLFFGLSITVTQAFIMMTVMGFAYLVPVPGGFGMFEGGQAAVAIWFGLDPIKLVAVAVVIRIRDLLFTVAGFVHILQFGARGFFNALKKEKAEIKHVPDVVKSSLLEKHNDKIVHGFFTKNGGISRGNFKTLNVRFGIGDDDICVRENRERIRVKLDLDSIVSSDQTHSDNIILVTGREKHELPNADSLICATPGVGIMIQTADCQPILIFDPEHNVVAAVHVGWKGGFRNILGKTISYLKEDFQTNPAKLLGVVGPCISKESYRFEDQKGIVPLQFKKYIDENKNLDLLQITQDQWIKQGCLTKNLQNLKICTFKNTDRFYSHRSEKGRTGRQASVIGILKV